MYLLLFCSPSKSPTHFWPQLSHTQWSHPGAAGGPNTPTYRQGNSKTDETAATKSAEKGSIACMQQFGPWCHLLWDKWGVYGMQLYSKISLSNILDNELKLKPRKIKRTVWYILSIVSVAKCRKTYVQLVMATSEVLWSTFIALFEI